MESQDVTLLQIICYQDNSVYVTGSFFFIREQKTLLSPKNFCARVRYGISRGSQSLYEGEEQVLKLTQVTKLETKMLQMQISM